MKATQVADGHPTHGRVDANAIKPYRPSPVPDGKRKAQQPHASARWIMTALQDLAHAGKVTEYTWHRYAWDGENYTYPAGGCYWVHLAGDPADTWHEANKSEIAAWLADVHGITKTEKPRQARAPRGLKGSGPKVTQVPASAPAPAPASVPAATGKRPLRVKTTIERLLAGDRSERVLASAQTHVSRDDVTEYNRARLAELLAA